MKTLLTALALAICLSASGCATGYGLNRARDAADIFTATLGVGAGLKARVGPVQAAAIENSDLVGLRAGAFLSNGNDLLYNEELYAFVPVKSLSRWNLPHLFGAEKYSLGPSSPATQRGKAVLARSPLPFLAVSPYAPFYSQIEVAGGLGLTVRLGFNPGELLDFLLGLAAIDIYGDDCESP